MAILSTLESTTLDETIRCTSKWFILKFKKKQNLKLVILKCVTYAQPIPFSWSQFINKFNLPDNVFINF